MLIPVAAQNCADRGPVLPALYHSGSSPVPKEDTGAPVIPVHHAAEYLGSHHQAVFSGGGIEQALHGVQGKEESGAGGVQVKADDVVGQPQLPLKGAGSGGHDGIRADGGHDAGPDFLRGHPRFVQRLPGGGGAQAVVALGLTVVPPADAGTAADPRVVGIHDLGQIIIGHYMGRDTPAHAFDLDPVHWLSFWGAAAPIFLNF